MMSAWLQKMLDVVNSGKAAQLAPDSWLRMDRELIELVRSIIPTR
jgi:hypothetical protein